MAGSPRIHLSPRIHVSDDEAKEQFLSIMEDQAARMRRLVDDLVTLSQIEPQEHTPPGKTAARPRRFPRPLSRKMEATEYPKSFSGAPPQRDA